MSNMKQLLQIMARLRHPKTGCPWDLQQDFSSLIPYTIEEAYEVADAIQRDDYTDLCEELGDLLLQVVFHSRLAEEKDLFDFESVAEGISEKLTRRHPHVFGSVTFKNDEERKQAWEAAKAAERIKKPQKDQPNSVLNGIAKIFPALVEAEKIQNRVANHGFDWPDVEPVFDKVLEELAEVQEAVDLSDQQKIIEEVGDLLFVAVNLARHLKVDAELALKDSNRKFTRRFHYIEEQVAAQGRSLKDCDLAELDAFWDQAKENLIEPSEAPKL